MAEQSSYLDRLRRITNPALQYREIISILAESDAQTREFIDANDAEFQMLVKNREKLVRENSKSSCPHRLSR